MEGDIIYEDSRKELLSIQKQWSTNNISIDLSKLDEKTKSDLLSAIKNVVYDRMSKIESVIFGVK